MAKRNWIVSVSSETDDPIIFGPYTRERAEGLAQRVRTKIETYPALGEDGYDGYIISANAYPIRNPGIREMLRHLSL